jgi:Family of unknown function (DUF5681)
MLAIMTEFTGDKQRPAHLFKPGTSGNPNGRPRGAKSKLSENFLQDLADCWLENGAEALRRCAREQPEVLIKVVASLLPRDVRIDLTVDAASFAQTFRDVRAALGNEPPPPRLRRPLPGRVIDHVGR